MQDERELALRTTSCRHRPYSLLTDPDALSRA
jgi:hypothetical protein